MLTIKINCKKNVRNILNYSENFGELIRTIKVASKSAKNYQLAGAVSVHIHATTCIYYTNSG